MQVKPSPQTGAGMKQSQLPKTIIEFEEKNGNYFEIIKQEKEIDLEQELQQTIQQITQITTQIQKMNEQKNFLGQKMNRLQALQNVKKMAINDEKTKK